MKSICLVAAALVAVGCASTLGGSHASNSKATDINGVPYRLPRVTMAIALVRSATGVRIEFTPPIYGPDKGADGKAPAYLLQYHPRSSAKDTFNISVDSSTGLLTSVTGEADDKGAQIVEEIGKLAGALTKPEAAVEKGEKQILFETIFDPGDKVEVTAVMNGLNLALDKPLKASLTRDCDEIVANAISLARPKTNDERARKESEIRGATGVCLATSKKSPKIWVEVDYTAFNYAGATALPCDVGVCTRVLSPAHLKVSEDISPDSTPQKNQIAARGFSMPNGSAPVPIELKRAAFAKVNYDIKLQNGLITTSNVIKESEALAIVSAPGKAIDAFFKSLANIVQLKIDLTTKQKELLQAEKDKLAAEKALEDAKKDDADPPKDGEPKAESAAEDAASTPFLSVEIPGLGIGSGMEIVSRGIPDAGGDGISESAQEARAKPKKDAKPPADSPPANSSEVLGGPVEGGSDGAKH